MEIDRIQQEYDNLTPKEKDLVHHLFKEESKFSKLYNELSLTIFKKIPPTPEEYLNPANGWISSAFEETIRQWIKEDFCSIINNSKELNIVSEYGATRMGKTTLALLLIHYTIIFFHHLRDANRYYGLAPTTSLYVFLLSFDYKKVYEVYLKPLYNLLESNDKFVQVKFQDQVKKEQKKYGLDKIVWSKASITGHITLSSGLQIKSGNDDALAIIGSNILSAFISEIAFFMESAGATEETIFRIYSDVTERIKATVGRNADLAFTYLDSSANNSESKIEKHILKDLRKRKDVFFRWRKRWDIVELHDTYFPQWKKTGETFLVCVGDGTYPARILYDKKIDEIKDVPIDLLVDVPIDSLVEFETNLIKSIKDIAGIPTTSESKFITDGKLIENIFDNPLLINEISIIIVDSKEIPDEFLWDRLKRKYFTKINDENYFIKRAQKEPRWIGVDLAHSVKGDLIGLSMGHKELNEDLKRDKSKDILYVSDFAFTVGPGENGINLESITDFILCLVRKGKINVRGIFVDSFDSPSMIQKLDRNNIPILKQSVDTQLDPYMFMYSLILNGQFKSGKNIFLKNNIRSLYRVTTKNGEKIDHSEGKTNNVYYGDWDKSDVGINAKDLSDACTQWAYGAHIDGYYPTTIYSKENERIHDLLNLDKDIKEIHDRIELLTEQAYAELHKWI